MKIILNHLIRNISEKKLRTAILVFTLLFSTMVLFLALSLTTIINDTYQMMQKGAYGDANIIISKNDDETNSLYKKSEIDSDVIPLDGRTDIIQTTGNSLLSGERQKVHIMGTSFKDAEKMGLVKPLEVSGEMTLTGDDAVISEKTASDHSLTIDDTIKVSIEEDVHTFQIKAISETKGIFYSELDTIQLIVPDQTLQNIMPIDDSYTSSLLKVPRTDLQESITTLKNANTDFTIDQPGSLESKSQDTETFQSTMIAAILIIILISSYVIISLAKVIVTERLPIIGTFRSIGATKRRMHSILALEFLLYGLIGASLGIVAAYFLLPIVADIFNEYKAYGIETDVSYNIGLMSMSFLFGLIFPVIISVFHILKANSQPLKDTILNTAHTKKQQSKVAVIIGIIFVFISFLLFFINKTDDQLPAVISFFLLLLGILFLMPVLLNGISRLLERLFGNVASGTVLLGIKNLTNNKIVANNCSMIIVVFLLMLMVGTTGKGLDSYVSSTVKTGYDVIIDDLEKDPTEYDDLSNVTDITDTDVQYIDLASYDINNHTGEFSMIAVDDIDSFASFYDGIDFEGDAKETFSNNDSGIIIDIYQKERYQLEIGDTIQLNTTSSSNETSSFDGVISGVMEGSVLNSNKTSVLIHRDAYNDYFSTEAPKIALKVQDDSSANTVKNELTDMYFDTDLSIYTFDEMIAGQKETIDTLLDGIIVVILLGLVIGLLGITNNFIVSFIQRKKEFAVLYAASMSRTQLIKMLIYEMMTTFVALVIIGSIGGFAMYIIMVKLLTSIGLVIPMTFHFGLFGLLTGTVFVLLALSTLSTIRRVMRLNILEQLRYE